MSLSRVPIAPHRVSRLGAARLGAARVSREGSRRAIRTSSSTSSSRARARASRPPRETVSTVVAIVMATMSTTTTSDVARALEANETPDNAFVARLVEKSANARETRAKERLDRYNEKNFGEYLKWEAGGKALRDSSALTENDAKIRAYLESVGR